MHAFIPKFNQWLKNNKNTFQFNPIEVHKKFKQLNKPYNPKIQQDSVDYNHIVDDILQISPPYNYCSTKDVKQKQNRNNDLSISQQIDNSFVASQRSIVPTKQSIKTIPIDASPQIINWNPSQIEEEVAKMDKPLTRLEKKRSSTFSITDIKNTTQKKIDNEDLFNKGSLNQSIDLSKLSKMYQLGVDPDNGEYDANFDNLLQPTNPKITKSIARRPNVPFGKSLSGFSNFSNSNDLGNNKSSLMQENNTNFLKSLQNSLVKLPADRFNQYDLDEKQYDNMPEIPDLSSRGNSFQMLFKNDPTPALFRNGSSIIDPRMLKKNN
jgi:hypothetical protein